MLRYACHYNTQHEITGVIASGNGQFIQLLAGQPQVIDALYERIQQDLRQEHLVRFADKGIAKRSCPAWSMAFAPVLAAQLAEVAGYVLPDRLSVTALGLSAPADSRRQPLQSFGLPPSTAR